MIVEIKLSVDFQVKIPCKPHVTLSDTEMTQYLETLCRTCECCENLISLEPGPEQCEKCLADEEKQEKLEKEAQEKTELKQTRLSLKRTMKPEPEGDLLSSNSKLAKRPKKVKQEEEVDIEDIQDDVSDERNDDDAIDSNDDGQEGSVSSTTTVPVITTTTTTVSPSDTQTSSSDAIAKQKTPQGPASEWSIEDVIQYISSTDPALAVHAELFRKHVSICSSCNRYITLLTAFNNF